MVKKLLKYEYQYYLRIILFILPVIFVVGLGLRILQFFKSDHYIYGILFTFAMFMLMFTSLACVLTVLVLAVIRFYKNLFSSEGYLTFSLPVTNHQHVISKIIAYLTIQIGIIICIVIAWIIAFIGVKEVWNPIFQILGQLFKSEYVFQFILIIIELVILSIITLITDILLYYACISLGQTAKKNRIFFSILVYYGYQIVVQVLVSIVTVVFSVLIASGSLNSVIQFISLHFEVFIHIFIWLGILLVTVLGGVYYFIIQKILKNKLNLE